VTRYGNMDYYRHMYEIELFFESQGQISISFKSTTNYKTSVSITKYIGTNFYPFQNVIYKQHKNPSYCVADSTNIQNL